MKKSHKPGTALNAICPYFTMFPLDFPLKILQRRARKGDGVLDPFCGRGTTNLAARILGLYSLGVDSSPVATAITASKLVTTTVEDIIDEAQKIIGKRKAREIPSGVFWQWAYYPSVLNSLCCFREELLENCSTAPRIALRGIILGALHGPKQKTYPSYFSNQCLRTFAPKPTYSVQYWKDRKLYPELVDVLTVIERRAKRYYGISSDAKGTVRLADSRTEAALTPVTPEDRFNWVITSPPYYGMRTYIPDQWLRNWFVGGPDLVDYTKRKQILHSSPKEFAADLRQVWRNVAKVCTDDAKMIIRFGGISDRSVNPIDLLKQSLNGSGWRIITIRSAGSASEGKRQADAFLRPITKPMAEYDVWTIRH